MRCWRVLMCLVESFICPWLTRAQMVQGWPHMECRWSGPCLAPQGHLPYVRARFAQGHPEELINRLRSLATPSKQLINTLLRLLRDHAAINKRFAHDIAQAFAKLVNQLAHALAHAAGQLLRFSQGHAGPRHVCMGGPSHFATWCSL